MRARHEKTHDDRLPHTNTDDLPERHFATPERFFICG
jgi:hypothetical protein